MTRRNDVFFPTGREKDGISTLQHDLSKVSFGPNFIRRSFSGFVLPFGFPFACFGGGARTRSFFSASAFFFRDERPFDEPDVASASAEAPPLSRETRVVSRAPE